MIVSEKNLVAHIYNPDNQTKSQLIDGFVVRLNQFNRLYKSIANATMQYPEQHLIIEGKRGMGKTTFLLRIAYEIENDTQLNTWLMPLVFNEEEYGVNRLFKLWKRVAQLLEESNDEFIGLEEEMDDQFERYTTFEAYEYDMFALLSKRLEEKGKKVILLIDNFGDIISKFKKQEVQRLREVLQTSNKIRIVAASAVVLEAHYDYRHPFYEFFKIIRLQGLNQEETETLLLKLGEVYKQETIKEIVDHQKGRVEALRRLSGGVIRSIVLMFEIFVDKQIGSAFHDLEAILDKATPLYKHRMDDLPAQQQEIMQVIALAWDAVNVKEIAKITHIPSKSISAQLRHLEKNELVTKILTSTKNHLYQINERFFNIWYLMRHGRKGDKRRVRWLVRFLEEWCDQQQLEDRIKEHIKAVRSGTYHVRGAYYMAEAMAHSKHISLETQEELLRETRLYLEKSDSEFGAFLSEADLDLMNNAVELFEEGDEKKAIRILEKIKKDKESVIGNFYDLYLENYEKAEKYYLQAIEKGNVIALYNLAKLYHVELKDYKKAKKYYLKAVEKNDIDALNNLAILYKNKFQSYEKAEKYFLEAIEKGNVAALYNVANLYNEIFKDYQKAEKYYLQAINKNHTNSFLKLANLYVNELKDYEKAKKYYLQAIEKGDVGALNNLALLYANELKDYRKAKKYYLQAIEKNDVYALNNLANLYKEVFGDYKKAEKYYLQAIEKGNAGALNNLAILYADELKDYQKAEKYYLQAIDREVVIVFNNLINLYVHKLKDYKKAEKYYLQAIEKGVIEAQLNLVLFYFQIKKQLKPALISAQNFIKNNNDDRLRESLAELYLWNNQLPKAINTISSLWYDQDFIEAHEPLLSDFLLTLFAKEHYSTVYDYFNSKQAQVLQLKDRLKPLYYATLYFLKDKEYLRMGDELKETVEEIVQKVEDLREEFKDIN